MKQDFFRSSWFQVAERFFVKADSTKDAIDMYNNAGQWEQAHRVSIHS